MNYLRDRHKKNQKVLYIIAGLLFFALIFYFRMGIYKKMSFLTNQATLPIIKVGANISSNFQTFRNYLASKNELDRENKKLKDEITELNISASNALLLEKENSELKEILSRKSVSSNQVLGVILTKPNRSPYDTILVDIGTQDAVALGDLVFAYGNIPLGKVADVYENYSKVLLFSTPGEKTEVLIGDTGVFMQIVGRGGGNFEMILPRDFNITEGVSVTLPGINSYVLAKVVTVISDPRDSYKKALLVSPVNIQQLRFIQIVK